MSALLLGEIPGTWFRSLFMGGFHTCSSKPKLMPGEFSFNCSTANRICPINNITRKNDPRRVHKHVWEMTRIVATRSTVHKLSKQTHNLDTTLICTILHMQTPEICRVSRIDPFTVSTFQFCRSIAIFCNFLWPLYVTYRNCQFQARFPKAHSQEGICNCQCLNVTYCIQSILTKTYIEVVS